MGPGAEALGRQDAELDPPVGLGEGQLLGVGVGDDEFPTPSRPASIMLTTALPPAPPTPKTTIRGFNSVARGAERAIVMGLLGPSRILRPEGSPKHPVKEALSTRRHP